MPLTADEVEIQALSLPRPGRVRILKALMASLEADPEADHASLEEMRRRMDEISMLWDEEADARHQAYLAGELDSIPAKEALAQLQERFEI